MFAKRLIELRGDKTQNDIALVLGIARARYAHYEQGRNEPSIEMLLSIAKYYNVSTDYLLGISPYPQIQKSESDYTPADYALLDIISNDSMLKEVVAEYTVLSIPQREAVLAMVRAMKK